METANADKLLPHLNPIAGEFEAAWVNDQRPLIAEYAGRAGPESRVSLLRELVRLDWEYRSAKGERPRLDEYVGQFPELLMSSVEQSGTWQRFVDRCISETMPDPVCNSCPTDTLDGRGPASSPEGESLSGSVIGDYRLRRKLGAGAAGEVWLAHDWVLDRDVAIKLLSPRPGGDDERGHDFIKEARATARLNHPNIVTVFQAGRSYGRVFIAMEYVECGSLSDELRLKGALTWREATQALRDAAAGLQAAHEVGIIHRDVKPSNLMRGSRGLVKVVDFGLASAESDDVQVDGAAAGRAAGATGLIVGSPAYMAPEQCRGERSDARSDLYSLICTYYQLLTRQLPFSGVGVASVMAQHCNVPFPNAAEKMQGLPDGVLRVLFRGSQKKPEKRYQTAATLLANLDALLATPEASHTFDGNASGLIFEGY